MSWEISTHSHHRLFKRWFLKHGHLRSQLQIYIKFLHTRLSVALKEIWIRCAQWFWKEKRRSTPVSILSIRIPWSSVQWTEKNKVTSLLLSLHILCSWRDKFAITATCYIYMLYSHPVMQILIQTNSISKFEHIRSIFRLLFQIRQLNFRNNLL